VPVSVRSKPAVWPWLSLLAVGLGLLGGVGWDLWPIAKSLALRSRAPVATTRAAPIPLPPERRRLRLFFPETASRLFREVEREVPRRGTLAAEVRAVLAELGAGEGHGEPPSVPPGVEIRHVFLDSFGILYLDLSREFQAALVRPHPQPELAVAAVANTLIGSFTEVKRVQFLLDGKEIPLLAGALDLGHPLSTHFPSTEIRADEIPHTQPPVPEQP
jgi:hypothetical protein